jgi:ribosomal protein S7
MRKKYKIKHEISPDPRYNSFKVEQLTNYIMKKGSLWSI